MLVKELIEKLQEMPGDVRVLVKADDILYGVQAPELVGELYDYPCAGYHKRVKLRGRAVVMKQED